MTFQQNAFSDALSRYGETVRGQSDEQTALAVEHAKFLGDDPEAFERSNPVGHFTGSALVVDPNAGKILLTHHAKMMKWQQLGGHCDGIRDPFFVAWKEAYEESGLKLILPASPEIFDLSLHTIPSYREVPGHLHYDVRYLFFADSADGFVKSDESLDLAWADLGRVCDFSRSSGLMRLEFKAIEHLERTHDYNRPRNYVEPVAQESAE